MFDDNDSETGVAVAIAIAVAICAALFAIGMATATSIGLFGKAPGTAGAAPAAMPAGVPHVGTRVATPDPADATIATRTALYFELGKYELPADALTRLAPLVALVRGNDAAKLVVSGFHDASGNAAANEELAKQRAFAVRDLLTTAGVPAERIELAKPVVTTGGADPREARRVDVSVR